MPVKISKPIVFFCLDAIGHINPIMSIGAELRRRGHRVILMTIYPLSMASKLQTLGFELVSCRDKKPDKQQSAINESQDTTDRVLAIMQPLCDLFRKGPVESAKATYGMDGVVARHFQDIVDNHDLIESKLLKLQPDVVIVDHTVAIPCIQMIPRRWVRFYSAYTLILYSVHNEDLVATVGLPTSEMTPEWKRFERSCKSGMVQRVKQFFKSKGGQVWDSKLELCSESPYLNLCQGPDELSPEHIAFVEPLRANWFRLEHSIDEDLEESSEFIVPKSLANLDGKLIYFSLGTMASCDYKLINRILFFLSNSPNKFIISMGQLGKFIHLYPNMWGAKFVDQRAVLRKADLFITHAGHNSVIEAFYYGVPGLITLPLFADQFDLSQRIHECGFGIRLNPFDCTQDELLSSIDLLLSNSGLRSRMSQISLRMRSTKYHKLAADKLEELISTGE